MKTKHSDDFYELNDENLQDIESITYPNKEANITFFQSKMLLFLQSIAIKLHDIERDIQVIKEVINEE